MVLLAAGFFMRSISPAKAAPLPDTGKYKVENVSHSANPKIIAQELNTFYDNHKNIVVFSVNITSAWVPNNKQIEYSSFVTYKDK